MPETAIKSHGGKAYLAKRIVDLMPRHLRYLEAFAGGLSVLLAKDPHDARFAYEPNGGCAEWINDTNGDITAFWQCMASEKLFREFQRAVEAMPFSESMFTGAVEAHARWNRGHWPSVVARAVAFFVRNRQSRQGLGESYATPTTRTRRGMNEHVSAWLTAIDGLEDVFYRMRRVEVWNRNAVTAIKALDGPDFLTYCDPPYLPSVRGVGGEYGSHEMSPVDHADLLATLANMQGKFILSGYHSEMYDAVAVRHGWYVVSFDLPNNASGDKIKERKTECLWMNYEPTNPHSVFPVRLASDIAEGAAKA